MFAPLYHQAAERGIAATLLDESPPHVVRWMLAEPPAPGALDATTEAQVRAARVAHAQGRGEKPEYVPFDPSGIGGRR